MNLKTIIESQENWIKYQVTEEFVNQVNKSVSEQASTLFVSTSTLKKTRSHKSFAILIVYQDLPLAEFLTQVPTLFGQYIYPSWYHQKPIYFFTKQTEIEYQVVFQKQELHQDHARLINKILLEQMQLLVEQENRIPPIDQALYPLDTLNKEQMMAVQQITGPVRLVAPAGSGKTKTLINRILNLMNYGIDPSQILVLAFNKKAEQEIRSRLSHYQTMVTVKTFHALGNEFLTSQLHMQYQPEAESKLIGEQLQKKLTVVTKQQIKRYQDKVSGIKNKLLPEAEMIVEEQSIQELFISIHEELGNQMVYNYDDMLYNFVEQLLVNPYYRHQYYQKYTYLLVDEFQDLNPLQLLLLEIISGPTKNIFIVGDDDQMIYSFRGASLVPITTFQKNNQCLKTLTLRTNYRSCPNIIKLANQVIKQNKYRLPKQMKPDQKQLGTIQVIVSSPLEKQVKEIISWINCWKTPTTPYRSFAILYRYHKYRPILTFFLDQAKIPYYSEPNDLFETDVGETILAYIRLIYYPEDSESQDVKQALRYPNKYFSQAFINNMEYYDQLFELSQIEDQLSNIAYERYQEWQERIQKLMNYKQLTSSQFLDVLGLRNYFNERYHLNEQLDYITDREVLKLIQTIMGTFDTVQEFYEAYCKNRDQCQPHGDAVHLMTIHKAKGKEWPNVIYFNLKKEEKQTDMEEERRIIYVGITRCEKNLLITSSASKKDLFVKEILK